MSDMISAIREFTFDLDRLISNAQGLRLSPQVHSPHALEAAIDDLHSAKVMLMEALIDEKVAH